MPKIRHPLSGVIYDIAEDGTVVLEKDGRTGRFTTQGVYLDGDIKTADPQLCGWIGGVQLPSRHQQMAEGSLFGEAGAGVQDGPPGGGS